MQRKILTTEQSRVSLLDVGLGVGVGFGAPIAAEMAIDKWGGGNETLNTYKREIAGGVGVLLALPLFYWRGLAPTVLAASMAIVYAVGPRITNAISSIGEGSGGGSGDAEFGRLRAARTRAARTRRLSARRSMGALQAGSRGRQVPVQSVAPRVAASGGRTF